MQVIENVQAAADFVAASIVKHGNMLADHQGNLYYVDDVVTIENTVVVVANGNFYVLCIQDSQFFVNGKYDEAANESVFWCKCAA
jgi:hypothetical protein